MSAATLQPLVGYGFDEASGDYRLNAAEEQQERRRSGSRWWRDQIERAAIEETWPEIEGPMTFTILDRCPGVGETFGSIAQVHERTGMKHPFYIRSATRLEPVELAPLFCSRCNYRLQPDGACPNRCR